MMSVDFPAALPSWKLALIERKRRQELDYHALGGSKSGADPGIIPPWKQEILSRKQQKQLGDVIRHDGDDKPSLDDILLSPEESRKYVGVIDPWPGSLPPVRDVGLLRLSSSHPGFEDERGIPMEERLPPIHQNPILLMDLENRRPLGGARPSNGSQGSGLLAKLSRLSVSSHLSFDGDAKDSPGTSNLGYDETFREEEVIYGKGFVSRLLQKFSYLSGREEVLPSGPMGPHFSRSLSRGQSSEDFSDSRYESGSRPTRPSKRKAGSLDDLLKENGNCHLVSENGDRVTDAESDCAWWPNQGGEGSVVHSVKHIFESLATSPTSAKDSSPHGRRSWSPERSTRAIPDTIRIRDLQTETSANNICNEGDVQRFPGSSKSFQEGHEVVKTTAQSHAITDNNAPNFSKRQASLILPDKSTPTAVTDAGINLREENHDDDKTAAQISYSNTEVSAHCVADSPESNISDSFANENLINSGVLTTETPIKKSSDLKISAERSQIRQNSVGRIPRNSEAEQNHSDSREPVGGNTQTKDSPASEPSAVTRKGPPPRPGLLLIRPASNFSNVKTDYLQMTKYNDIKHGEFVPAKKPVQKSVQKDDFDSDEFDESADISKYLRTVHFEFEGAGISLGRSLLAKSKHGAQLKTSFDDVATSVFEYPSEQSLVDSWPLDSESADVRNGWDGAQSVRGAGLTSYVRTSPVEPSKTEVDSIIC